MFQILTHLGCNGVQHKPPCEKTSLDLTIDESMWSNMSYSGDACFQVQGKLGVTKSGQNAVVLDSKQHYTHAWYHRHGLNPKTYDKPFTQQGPHEVKILVAMLDHLILGNKQEEYNDHCQIFSEPPHLTFDDHFDLVAM